MKILNKSSKNPTPSPTTSNNSSNRSMKPSTRTSSRPWIYSINPSPRPISTTPKNPPLPSESTPLSCYRTWNSPRSLTGCIWSSAVTSQACTSVSETFPEEGSVSSSPIARISSRIEPPSSTRTTISPTLKRRRIRTSLSLAPKGLFWCTLGRTTCECMRSCSTSMLWVTSCWMSLVQLT